MTTKFTPGPWGHDSGMYGNGKQYHSIFAPADDVVIAEFNAMPEFNPEQGKANAHLIAAAPEMYADALDTEHAYSWLMQELRDLKSSGASWDADRVECFADSLIAYCDAHQIGTRAVLAKAQGGAA